MKHLFILNPAAEKIRGRVNTVIEEIQEFFRAYGQLEYDIRVTRWTRDASAFVHRYALEADGLVRIHCFGGMGTLFEIINGIVGLPGVQVAVYPMGKNNSVLRYFGKDKTHLFASLRNQVFSNVTPMDVMRCGGNYGICYGLVGLEAESTLVGTEMIARSRMKSDLYFILPTAFAVLQKKHLGRRYRVTLDGRQLDGEYITMMIANSPCYGKNMNPAVEAHPNDGLFDLYLVRDMSKLKFLASISLYLKGHYDKAPGPIEHYSGKKLVVSADSVMCLSIDGESFYENAIEYEILPRAIDFVCPHGIDVEKLPLLYGRPKEGASR